ncbi:hypothetical protein [uncultured Roseobacter sp.]|uniref:hypothetical protein n=1 Tax=uncultured Roseobacter sp. TaxID=114847 RepID=UPI0026383C89|nr:hypothetical protein [uncultured Roseobacter sp.]
MNGSLGFWLRIVLIAGSGAFAANSGVQFYDPATETITIHVDQIGNLIAALGGMGLWKLLHGKAVKTGGKT